jgi:hypothetical protein
VTAQGLPTPAHHRSDATRQVSRWTGSKRKGPRLERQAVEAVPLARRLADALDGAAPPCAEAPEWMFPERRGDAEVAIDLLCMECPALIACGEYGAALGAVGIWGGRLLGPAPDDDEES